MKKYIVFTIGLFVSLLSCAQKKANDIVLQEDQKSIKAELVVPNLEIAWGFTWLPDGSMLINEQNGEMLHFKNGETKKIKGVPKVRDRGQGGLLDIELHPKYKNNKWIYFTYSSPEGNSPGAHTALMRAKLVGDSLVEKELLYKATPNTKAGHHFGSRIEFDAKGFLYFSIGERGQRKVNPQDITRDGGKIYRLHDDGSIPKDNPFVSEKDAKKAIYSYGHRNPQGMAMHPKTGEIWIHEHGPRGGDEINVVKKAANYGWPVITYGINYSGTSITDITEKAGMEQPLYYWVPSIAPCGMAFVTSKKYKNWKHGLLVGSLKYSYLELLKFKKGKVISREKILDDIGRVRNVRQGPDGYLYISVEDEGIFKLIEK